ncbi:uncharacterized protein LOC130735299 isoform X1 [Lotus japonicus]|uniref:uncharacterized protein LOC130735299 isoform X1 n=1 Tax=Lotus japonicus TaxID=34305 RepID=UPI002582C303|nr:uncharacterized protein LOC130735299 isoform X1 [Lotus japonicus]
MVVRVVTKVMRIQRQHKTNIGTVKGKGAVTSHLKRHTGRFLHLSSSKNFINLNSLFFSFNHLLISLQFFSPLVSQAMFFSLIIYYSGDMLRFVLFRSGKNHMLPMLCAPLPPPWFFYSVAAGFIMVLGFFSSVLC